MTNKKDIELWEFFGQVIGTCILGFSQCVTQKTQTPDDESKIARSTDEIFEKIRKP